MSTPKPSKTFAGGRIGFYGSFPDVRRMPALGLPEVAFAGRSNVGKSSAINRLVRSNGVARVSKTPGRTQHINLFSVDHRIAFADLPGYGFARVPEEVKAQWKGMVEGYFANREALQRVVVLVDSRHSVQTLDAELIWGLRQAHVPILVLATKLDKVRRSKQKSTLNKLRNEFKLSKSELVGFSSLEGTGIERVWELLLPKRPKA
jgi:GTP-binding protein